MSSIQPTPVNQLTEDQLRTMLFQSLVKQNPSDVIVERWSSHSVKTGSEVQRQFLLNEIEVGRFRLAPVDSIISFMGGLKNVLSFTAFEVKGNTKTSKGSFVPPSTRAGIEQAVVNLHQGADYSVIVRPDPGDEKRGHLIKMCETYAPRVDLWLYDGKSFVGWKQSPVPIFNAANEQEKRRMLTMLIASGGRSRINLPDWAKQGKY